MFRRTSVRTLNESPPSKRRRAFFVAHHRSQGELGRALVNFGCPLRAEGDRDFAVTQMQSPEVRYWRSEGGSGLYQPNRIDGSESAKTSLANLMTCRAHSICSRS